jgi:hypothetical protein
MKTRQSPPAGPATELPNVASLAALRAWYEGLSAREAVTRFLMKADGQSSRGVLGAIRRELAALARPALRAKKLLDKFFRPLYLQGPV